MKLSSVRGNAAVALAGLGLVSPAWAQPVPLAKPLKPPVSIAAVREAADLDGTVRAAPEIAPPALFDSGPSRGLPTLAPFPGPSGPRSVPAFEPFPGRGGRVPASTAFDPFGGAPGRAIDARTGQPNPGGVRGLWNGFTKWTGDRAKALAEAVVGPEQLPDPRVGRTMPPGMNPNGFVPPNGPPPQARMPMQPFRGTTPGGRAAYAGNPAYRWYGWGTTTPGTNPFAPGGEYPSASAQWYTMSGATPGAFPVPVTNPFRPVPGSGAPAYAVNALPAPVPSVPPPGPFVTAMPAVPDGPKPIVETAPFRYVPPDELPTTMGPAPSVPGFGVPAATGWHGGGVPLPPRAEEFPARPSTTEPTWQPIHKAAPARGPVLFIGQSPAKPAAQPEILQAAAVEPVAPVSLIDRVRVAAGADVRNVEAKRLGRDGVIVRFDAPTDAAAEAAAKAIAAIPDLKPYTVTFDVVVGK